MILYNITFRDDLSTVLYPHVPYSAAAGEDNAKPRICLSDTIQHCIEAVGPCKRDMFIGSTFIVRSANTNNLSLSSLLGPKYLFQKQLVPDALETQEYWYLGELPVSVNKVLVEDFSMSYDIAWSCIKKNDILTILCEMGIPYTTDYSSKSIDRCTAKDIYDSVMSNLVSSHRHDDIDDLWDNISELPFAQKITLTNLKLKYLI